MPSDIVSRTFERLEFPTHPSTLLGYTNPETLRTAFLGSAGEVHQLSADLESTGEGGASVGVWFASLSGKVSNSAKASVSFTTDEYLTMALVVWAIAHRNGLVQTDVWDEVPQGGYVEVDGHGLYSHPDYHISPFATSSHRLDSIVERAEAQRQFEEREWRQEDDRARAVTLAIASQVDVACVLREEYVDLNARTSWNPARAIAFGHVQMRVQERDLVLVAPVCVWCVP
jgi:hypothetical protein